MMMKKKIDSPSIVIDYEINPSSQVTSKASVARCRNQGEPQAVVRFVHHHGCVHVGGMADGMRADDRHTSTRAQQHAV